MGKRKKRSSKQGLATSQKNESETQDKEKKLKEQKFTAEDLLVKVHEYMECFNFELADRFCTRAVELYPDNLEALDVAASVYLEIGKNDEAVRCLKHAIELEPGKGFSKYMTLGELFDGEDAVDCLKKGIELMIDEKSNNEKENVSDSGAVNTEVDKITDRDISNAFCSLAEIYLTDCCFAENAENSCKVYCEKAIEQDADNPEAFQVMASFLLSEQKNEEAKEMLLKSLNLWQSCEEPQNTMSSYQSRVSLSKMLIEVNEFDNACKVLEGLLSEDDEVVQVWYLLGWINYLKEQDYNLVLYYLEMAQKLFSETECDDEPLLEHIKDILSEIREKTNSEEAGLEQDDGDEEPKSMDTTE